MSGTPPDSTEIELNTLSPDILDDNSSHRRLSTRQYIDATPIIPDESGDLIEEPVEFDYDVSDIEKYESKIRRRNVLGTDGGYDEDVFFDPPITTIRLDTTGAPIDQVEPSVVGVGHIPEEQRQKKLRMSALEFATIKNLKKSDALDYGEPVNNIYALKCFNETPQELRNKNIFLWMVAIISGLVIGAVGICLRLANTHLNKFKFNYTYDYLEDLNYAMAWFVFTAYAGAFGIASSIIVIYVFPLSGASGIPDVKTYLNGNNVPQAFAFSTIIGRLLSMLLTVVSSNPSGLQGPLLSLGAGIASWMLQQSRWFVRRLCCCASIHDEILDEEDRPVYVNPIPHMVYTEGYNTVVNAVHSGVPLEVGDESVNEYSVLSNLMPLNQPLITPNSSPDEEDGIRGDHEDQDSGVNITGHFHDLSHPLQTLPPSTSPDSFNLDMDHGNGQHLPLVLISSPDAFMPPSSSTSNDASHNQLFFPLTQEELEARRLVLSGEGEGDELTLPNQHSTPFTFRVRTQSDAHSPIEQDLAHSPLHLSLSPVSPTPSSLPTVDGDLVPITSTGRRQLLNMGVTFKDTPAEQRLTDNNFKKSARNLRKNMETRNSHIEVNVPITYDNNHPRRKYFCPRWIRSIMIPSVENDKYRRDFLSIGAASGISAAMGAPIAGLLNVIEDFAISAWSIELAMQILCASVIASVTAAFIGTAITNPDRVGEFLPEYYATFFVGRRPSTYQIQELPVFILLGILVGIVGGIFTRVTKYCLEFRNKYISPYPFRFFLVSTLVLTLWSTILFGMPFAIDCEPVSPAFAIADADSLGASSGTYGVVRAFCDAGFRNPMAELTISRYDIVVKRMLARNIPNSFAVGPLIFFFVILFIGCIVTNSAASSPGVVLPLLLVGSVAGRIVGKCFYNWFGYEMSTGEYVYFDPGVYAAVGCAAIFAATTRNTITHSVLILEITADLNLLLPILLGAFTAHMVSTGISMPYYEMLIAIRKLPYLPDIPSYQMTKMMTSQIMVKKPVCIGVLEQVEHLLQILESCDHNCFPVVVQPCSAVHHVPSSIAPYNPEGKITGLHSLIDGRSLLYGARAHIGEGCDKSYVGLILRNQLLALINRRVWRPESKPLTPMDFARVANRAPPKIAELRHRLTPRDLEQCIDLMPWVNTSNVITTDRSLAADSFYLFRKHSLRHLPVVDVSHEIVGMITRFELLNSVVQHKYNILLSKEAAVMKRGGPDILHSWLQHRTALDTVNHCARRFRMLTDNNALLKETLLSDFEGNMSHTTKHDLASSRSLPPLSPYPETPRSIPSKSIQPTQYTPTDSPSNNSLPNNSHSSDSLPTDSSSPLTPTPSPSSSSISSSRSTYDSTHPSPSPSPNNASVSSKTSLTNHHASTPSNDVTSSEDPTPSTPHHVSSRDLSDSSDSDQLD